MEKPKILIIDDDEALCESLRDTIELEGYLTVTADNAEDGTTKVENGFYNIILLDLKLPDSNGIAILEKIKAISPDTEVIIFTAYAEMNVVIKAMDRNAFSFLPKPFEISYMLIIIKRALEKQGIVFEHRKLFQTISNAKKDWETTFDSISDLISIQDTDFNVIKCNYAVADKFNVELKDIIGKKCYEVFHGTSEPLPTCPCARCMETLRPETEETTDPHTGGTFLLSCFPRFDIKGKISGTVTIARDITEHKRSERALKESESKFRTLVGNIPGATYRCAYDANSTMEYISDEIEKICGYPPSDFLNNKVRTYASIVRQEDSCLTKETVNDSLKNKKPFTIEYRIVDSHKRTHWVFERGQGIFDEKGEVRWLDGTIIDITERKQIEDALKVSEEKFRSISATANDAIIMVNNEGKISYWNEAAEGIFGFSKKEAIGKDISNTIIPKRLREDHLRGFKKFSETGQGPIVGKTVELTAIRKDGSKFPIEVSLSAIRLKDKWNAVSIIRDITERKKDEEALWQRVNELTALNRLSQQVSASLSLDQVVKVALDGIASAIDPEMTLFFLRDGDELYLQGAISKDTKHKQDETIVHRVGEYLCGLVVSEKKPLYSSDICSDPRCTWGECKKSGLRSFAGLPLWGRDEIIGVLGVASVTPKEFEKQNTFLETLTNEVSFALQNALLHMQLEQHTKDLEGRVADRTKELAQINTNLEEKNKELERFNKVFVEREFRIKDLRDRIKKLEERRGAKDEG